MNKHEVLYPQALPNPSRVAAFEFLKAYKRALPPYTPNTGPAGTPGATGGSIDSAFARELNAGMPPTAETIGLKLQQRVEEIRQKNAFLLPNGQIGNEAALTAMVAEETQKLPARLREEVANGSKVYVSPDTFESYPRFATVAGSAPDPIDIYFAQLGYWIQQDVVNAVKEVNAPAKNVMEAPVKHLISVRVKAQGIPTFVTDPSGQNTTDPDAQLPKAPTISPTGRVCNALYDVYHFQVKADVQADKVADYIRALSTNRFITPMWIDVKSVDNATALAQGHFYGDKPVLTVTAECEILYLRKWNAPLMPRAIRQRLAIPDEQPAGAPGAAPGATPDAGATPAADTQPPDAAPPGVPLPGDPVPGAPAPAAPAAPAAPTTRSAAGETDNERPTMAYPAAAPNPSAIYEAVSYEETAEPAAAAPPPPAASAIYDAVTYENRDEPSPAPPTVDVSALAAAATQTAIPEDIAYAVTAPSRSAPAAAHAAPRAAESTTSAPAASGNRTFLIVLIVIILAGAGIAAALMLT
jgi:hypothetical protein